MRFRLLASLVALGTLVPGMVSAQSLSHIVPDLVNEEVRIAASPTAVDHTGHFFSPSNPLFRPETDPTQQVLREQLALLPELNRQIGAQLATFPLGSSSSAFTYDFDPDLGIFTRSSSSFGPFLTERAFTIGKGQFGFGANYQHASYDRFEGRSLLNPTLTFYNPHNDCCPGQLSTGEAHGDGSLLNPAFEGDVLKNSVSMRLRTDTLVTFANYGVTDEFEVGVVVPFVHVSLDAAMVRTILRLSTASDPRIHSFDDEVSDTETEKSSGSANGIGDVLLRFKYRFLSRDRGGLAAAAEVRLPSGDPADLLGTGAAQAKLFVIGSGKFGVFAPHVNFGYTFSGSVSEETRTQDFISSPADELNYSIGFDAVIHPRVTVAGDLMGRQLKSVSRLRDASLTFHVKTLEGLVTDTTESGFSIETGNMGVGFGAAGLKVNLARTLVLSGALIFSLTDNGLTNRIASTVGVDYTFGR